MAEGNTLLEGRVEVCMDNQWGTVCQSNWGAADAQVVCRQLGLSPTGIDEITFRADSYVFFTIQELFTQAMHHLVQEQGQ